MKISELKAQLAEDLKTAGEFKLTPREAIVTSCCIKCGKGAGETVLTDEFVISGLCDPCFDGLFPEE